MKNRTKKKLLEVVWFLVKLNLLAIPLYILIFLNFSCQPLQNFVAFLSYKLLRMLGVQVGLNQSLLTVIYGFRLIAIQISMDCIGWKSLYALAALVIATPAVKFKKKLRFLILGLPLLFLLNIARIAMTIYLSLALEPSSFSFVHDILWQWGLIFAVLGVWAVWLKCEKRI